LPAYGRVERTIAMNLVSGNITASQRDILGLPVCDLGWAEAFAFAEEVATMPFGQTVIAFINAGNANLMMRDPEYRSVLERQVVLPDGDGVDIASRPFDDRKFPANFTGAAFVPALFTYIAKPMRIALIGARQATLLRAADNLGRHAPWHEFLPISDGDFDRARSDEIMERVRAANADILLVATDSPAQEKWIDKHVGPGHARLVLSLDALFDTIANEVPPVPEGIRRLRLGGLYRLMKEPSRLRQQQAQLAFAYHMLRYKFLAGPVVAQGSGDTAKAGSLRGGRLIWKGREFSPFGKRRAL
jgi:exopolysaccharide biosynthesis WecB/TagA/CpsF family protein